jgi:glycosyltransferase involved in cell wall biosynthesis
MGLAITWHLITGEYPPKLGGVAAYTAQLANALAAAGDEVDVWFPGPSQPSPSPPGIQLHPLPGHFGPAALARLDAGLARSPRPRILFVQYVPHAFGWKAMNLPFCYWLYRRRHRERIWAMFHEVAFPVSIRQPVRHNVLGAVTRAMAALVARAAERSYVATEGLVPFVRRFRSRRGPVEWLPVPSSLPTTADGDAVAAVRRRFASRPSHVVVGHFGTYPRLIGRPLTEALSRILRADTRRVGLLIGWGGQAFADRMAADHPELAGRLFAPGGLTAADTAAYIAACDLLVQPYPDGVCARRSSMMACLGLGAPVVTTRGHSTEPLWEKEKPAALVPVGNVSTIAAACDALLADENARRALGRRGRAVYDRWFRLERAVQTFRRAGGDPTAVEHTRT